MANIPNIRFKGFTDDWEQHKILDIAEFSKGQGYSKGDLKEHGTPIILYGRLYTKYETRITDVDTFVDAKPNSVYSKGGEVIIPASGETAKDIARAATVEKSGVLLGGDLNVVTPNNEIDSAFLALSISNGNAQKELAKKAQGKSVVHIHSEEIKGLIISFPKHAEQQKIALYFDYLDHLITLHQRKCDETKELKKYMLQKMFPQNRKKIPEIRFAGFTDDWEQRKLGEIAGRTYGGGTPKTAIVEYWDGDIPWIQSSNLTEHELFNSNIQKYITDEGLAKSAAQLIPPNSIAVVSHVGVGKLVFMPFSYTTSQDFISLSELKAEPIFTCYSIYKRLQNDIHIVQGSAIKGITKDDLLNKEILLPSELEQAKIGMYFRNLDHLITLHQRKCDELKEVKKFMLQNMFPQKG